MFDNVFKFFATLGLHFSHPFETFGRPFGGPGASLGGFVDTFWAALSPKVQNVDKSVFPNPPKVSFLDTILAHVLSTQSECVESVGSQVVFSTLFRGSRDRLTSIRCSLRSPITVFHVRCRPRKCIVCTYFLVSFWSHSGTFVHVFGVFFQSLMFREKWEERRGLGWAGMTAIKSGNQGLEGNNDAFWPG